MTDYQIAPITEEYIAGFREAVGSIAQEREYLAFLEAPPIESTKSYVLQNIESNHPHFVVIRDSKVIGWCDVVPKKSRPVYEHTGILGIGLLPEFRRQGIGHALMKCTIAAAFDFGLTRIELTVREKNTSAIALYKAMGFEVEGLHRNAVCIDGQYENLYSMALLKN